MIPPEPSRDGRSEAVRPPPDAVEAKLRAGGRVTWDEFVDVHTGTLFRVVGCCASDYDERMDLFLHVCEALRAQGMKRIHAYRFRPDAPARFATYLAIVARNLVSDFRRARLGRAREFAATSKLDAGDRLVAECRYRDGLGTDELRRLFEHRFGVRESRAAMQDRIARVERALTASQRWRLLARRFSRQPAMRLDEIEAGSTREPADRGLSEPPSAEGALSGREAGQVFERVLAAMPRHDRLVLAFRFRDGRDVATTARALGVSTARVERATRDALDALRLGLGRQRVGRDDLERVLGSWWERWEESA